MNKNEINLAKPGKCFRMGFKVSPAAIYVFWYDRINWVRV
jgi:hypothetical protein